MSAQLVQEDGGHQALAMKELKIRDTAVPKLVAFLSYLLHRMAESNDLNCGFLSQQKTSAFHSLIRPTISVQSYLQRIFKYANCSPACYVIAYIYLDRFSHRQPEFPINSFTVHRLLITSVMVAAKFMDDIYYNNAYYAKIGGISTAEMNFLEVDFLFRLGFHLNVAPDTYHSCCSYLYRQMLLHSPLDHSNILSTYHQPLVNDENVVRGRRSSVLHSLCFRSEEEPSHHQQQQLAV